jgi:hypothetical protein
LFFINFSYNMLIQFLLADYGCYGQHSLGGFDGTGKNWFVTPLYKTL